jgi:hypothetical protein
MKPLPNVYAVQCVAGRWLMIAPSEQTLARTFDRRKLRAADVIDQIPPQHWSCGDVGDVRL